MLYLANAETPRGTLQAVLDFLNAEAARYERDANRHTVAKHKSLEMARCNALRLAVMSLEDCNVMQPMR